MADEATQGSDVDRSRLSRVLTLVGTGYLFLLLADPQDGIAKLSLQYILKDHLHLNPAQLAAFFAVANLAWYCKPLAGLLTDNVHLLGTRRKGYLLVASGTAGFLWAVLAFAHATYAVMLWTVLVINIALMVAQTTFGGMLVEAGQEFRATGRISSVRSGAESLGGLTAGLIGGWIAQRLLGIGLLFDTALMAILFFLVVALFREKPVARKDRDVEVWTLKRFWALFHSKTMWIAAGFWLLVRFAPGFGTPLFFYQTETLKFTPEFIGFLGFVSGAGGILSCLTYLWLCHRYALRNLLYLGVVVNVVSSLCYFAYRSHNTAIALEGIYGFGNGFAFMPILDLLARATPKRSAALGYSLIFSLGNISVNGSNVLGSWLFDRLDHHFMPMVWLNSGTSALVLLAIPFLPKLLVSHSDGQAAQAA